MQNAAGSNAAVQSAGRDDHYHAIVSDLMCLMEQVQASIKLVESAIAGAALPGNQEVTANIVVLDDVTPRYARANTALNTCKAGLGIALHILLDARTSEHGTDGSAGSGRLRLV